MDDAKIEYGIIRSVFGADSRGVTYKQSKALWGLPKSRSMKREDNDMRVNTRTLSAVAIMLVLVMPLAAWEKHGQIGEKQAGMAGMKSEMSKMMQSPHHLLMMQSRMQMMMDKMDKDRAIALLFPRWTRRRCWR